jgi:hypothetical protein
MSSNAASLRDRLLALSPRGWLRMDGLPFTDDASALLDERRIFYPVRYDERGGAAVPSVMIGANPDGTTNSNCEDWTSNSEDALMFGGSTTAGPFTWAIYLAGYYCAQSWPVLCMGVTHPAAVALPVTAGRRIWLTNAPHTVGSMTPDEHCQLDRPAGVGTGSALVAYTGRAAADQLDPNATYVRPDGQAVGTGAEIAAGRLRTGIWQRGNGDYPSGDDGIASWTGSSRATDLGTADSTCDDWTNPDGRATSGVFAQTNVDFWSSGDSPCREIAHLYCVE